MRIAGHESENILAQQLFETVLDVIWVAIVLETVGKPVGQAESVFEFAQPQIAGIRRQVTPVKTSSYFAAIQGFKFECL